ncbi:unnamed protein product [Bursaphelenchus okinawaensis]|uniref:rRNA adenine N(6)-methyltransferase n=1 Tax=Bursaphelenchus okinawaensis TaxID=465554 RepID=A0A811JQG5_9BILA|nr:unnamed protein product [Bursaphelenchus okinawaensis]CAG9078180.1 unnamed protein product [Bursaphelenchus okinawaensis]
MASTSKLPPLPALRDFIHMYQLKATKVLSQNYIMDMNINRKVVRSSGLKPNGYALEIGPGPGGITRAILEKNPQRFDVVEIDNQFKEPLEVLREASDNVLNIHMGNVLKTDLGEIMEEAGLQKVPWWDEPPNYRLIGNLPFNIASPLIIQMLRHMAWRRGPWGFGRVPLTLTFQLEVAKRICSPIDCDERSRISIVSQFVSDPKLVFVIPGQCFVPRPQVDVGVVTFVPREEPLIETSFEIVEKVARHVFHYRQKNIIHPVKTLYPPTMAKDMAHDLLKNCRLNPTYKPYQLGIPDFADICLYYEKQCRETPGLYAYHYFQHKRHDFAQFASKPDAFPPTFDVLKQKQPNFKHGISLAQTNQSF